MTRRSREQRAAERSARRASLFVLLDRAQRRGSLTAAEAALLRAHVEAEVAECDRYRAEAGGQQAAVRREQQRVRAAEAAICEGEALLADVRTVLPADARPRLGLPNTLAYENGRHDMADAVRNVLDQP
ncbi:hypothetical protein H9Y04_15960 [Streptomyces sp. TRM66268-LWL]|uniref:Uncharacterized protein n=1 Tax=Streptomyces polyasparticus TaxID=2767826 RepID=A0ABR7SEY4_9ACTN|nr:hypothetical protein [Streptomyces polyasparticus]MBC9714060.1 hypothetical protein [Streptomyces polyasparticus]